MRVEPLDHSDSKGAKCSGTQTSSAQEYFFEPLEVGDKKASLAKSFFIALSIQALRGLPYLGSSAVPCASGTQRGPPSWGPTL